ncbi:Crp/Fnr family transcriptional regulator [Caldisalinibacter kiritimatiensis]|uniref:Hcp transcriptional regulator HcpR (Crp/Fnr family) n=1 Tax=Caldisalinibacter kiritimatiensis TaxID=1304284 RepID=R1CPF8_9FIRM|nr:Crp/Fnr family transcriptional regulator [Caldisalinibacter kiritimatiensis]EOD00551.1 Hcp transcriptional regulator HcpR (Crp/Fnr family) [Caldisalinibacter kiritimatiensis]
MDNIEKILTKCFLFKGLSEKHIVKLLQNINYQIKTFSKNETIAIEGENCNSIGIVIKGSIEVQKIYPSGKTITVSRIKEGDSFAEVIIFSDVHKYPSTIIASNNSKVMFISKTYIIELCKTNTYILNNFMELLSNKIFMLSTKLKNLSYETIRDKICNYLLEEYNRQNSLTIKLNYTKKELSDQFGIPRPSLSRELIKMKKDGLIDFDRKSIKILNVDKIENQLF